MAVLVMITMTMTTSTNEISDNTNDGSQRGQRFSNVVAEIYQVGMYKPAITVRLYAILSVHMTDTHLPDLVIDIEAY